MSDLIGKVNQTYYRLKPRIALNNNKRETTPKRNFNTPPKHWQDKEKEVNGLPTLEKH